MLKKNPRKIMLLSYDVMHLLLKFGKQMEDGGIWQPRPHSHQCSLFRTASQSPGY